MIFLSRWNGDVFSGWPACAQKVIWYAIGENKNPCILSRMIIIIIIYKRQRERIVKKRKNRIFYQTNNKNCVIIYLWKREPEQSLVWSGDKALETGVFLSILDIKI